MIERNKTSKDYNPGEIVYVNLLHPIHMEQRFYAVQVVEHIVEADVVVVQPEMHGQVMSIPGKHVYRDTSLFRTLYR